ncbi:uncharacterized protein BDV17DRAFT_275970 [Aspergillus undulatus]|uniref:uncharacterized protein n=1 Tax=Aspergillus undulatus TaxID=1810928 RepID=UPI003CCE1CFF
MVQKCMKRVKRSEHSDAPSSTSTTSKSSQPASPAKYSKSSKSEPAIGRCWDWIITRGNCHYAKDRASFARYRNISHLVSFCPDEPPFTPIAGVGTVIVARCTSCSQCSLQRILAVKISPLEWRARGRGTNVRR